MDVEILKKSNGIQQNALLDSKIKQIHRQSKVCTPTGAANMPVTCINNWFSNMAF